MLDITILAIGKMSKSFLKEGVEIYLSRLKPYAKISLLELAARSFNNNNKLVAKKNEAELIEKYISKNDVEVFLLQESGRLLDSLAFSKELYKFQGRKIVLVLGGALGFNKELSLKYPSLSLSTLTFTHEMARLILLEQIYRAVSIERGKDYHY